MKRRNTNRLQSKDYYPVEAIKSKRYNPLTGNYEYFIKWEGWAEKYNTWEPISNIVGCDDLIEAFENQYKCFPNQTSNTGQNGLLSQSITEKLSQYHPKDNFKKGAQILLNLLNKEMQKRMNCEEPIIIQGLQPSTVMPSTTENNSQFQQENKSLKEKVNNFCKQNMLNLLNQNDEIKIQQNPNDDKKNEIKSSNIRPTRPKQIKVSRKNYPISRAHDLTKRQSKLILKRSISKARKSSSQTLKPMKSAPLLKEKGQRVSEALIQQSKVKIIDAKEINGKLNYLIVDLENNCVPIYATKEELIQVNPYVLLGFFEQMIN